MRNILTAVLTLVSIVQVPLPPASEWLIPPVDGPISARFEPPASDFGSGHRGIDFEVPAGTPVRAAADGVVTFAGEVGGRAAASIAHEGGLRTTYSWLEEVHVWRGDEVASGRLIGTSSIAHEGGDGLHFGVKLNGEYVDPQDLLGPLSLAGAVRLAPLVDAAPDVAHVDRLASRSCTAAPDPGRRPPPPTRNVVVFIPGLDSSSAVRGRFEGLGRALGYPSRRTYVFSYRGSEGPGLHRSYEAPDTHARPERSVVLLAQMLRKIKMRHQGRPVDLLAHSQGGLIARSYLEFVADRWDPTLPVVEGLVTMATPHGGVPLAGAVGKIRDDKLFGDRAIEGLGEVIERWPVAPDPRSPSLRWLAPDSETLQALDTQDVSLGTRVLALGRGLDPLAPGSVSYYEGKNSSLVPGAGHTSILESEVAVAASYAFLRGAGPPCGKGSLASKMAGKAVQAVEVLVPEAYDAVAQKVVGRVFKVLGGVVRRIPISRISLPKMKRAPSAGGMGG